MVKFPEASPLCSLTQFLSLPLDSATCEKCPEDQWPNRELSVHPQNPRLLALPRAPHRSVGRLHSPALPPCSGHILGIFVWHHHTPVVQANNHQLSYLLLCPPWPSVSSAPSCSLVIQSPSPVPYTRQLWGSPSQSACPLCWPRPLWWWQPSMPPGLTPGLGSG